jgi:hypothetical protein
MVESLSEQFTPRDVRHLRAFHLWLGGAVLAFIAATVLIDQALIPAAAGWALTALSVMLMAFAIRAYMVFLRGADELLRKIHLDALALAFGVGAIAMMGYRLCERLGAPKLDVNDPFLVMMLVWALGQWIGLRRYAAAEES